MLLSFGDTRLIRLTSDYAIKEFDCGDKDLNDFIINDSKSYLQKLLAVTYILETPTEMVAFLSLLNDKISSTDVSNETWKKKFKKVTGKGFKSHPAVKIGRLGVATKYHSNGIGRRLLNFTKDFFTSNNRTGCRFITVDAYKESLDFYQKAGFTFLTAKDENKNTRAMYFDLMPLK